MTTAWLTNTTLEDIAAALRESSRVVLLTHEKPDGDAVGSTLALARALGLIGVEATPVYVGAWPDRFDVIVGATRIEKIAGDGPLEALPENADRVVVVDTGSWSQLAKVRPWLESRRERTIVIDHHLHGDGDVASMRHIESAAPAASLTVAEVCRLLLCLDRMDELPRDIATPLYLGLATDTGWFRHSNVTPEAFRLAADLIEAGVEHSWLYTVVELTDRPARLKLIGRAFSNVEFHADEMIGVISITQEDMKACGADQDETGGLTDMLLTVESVLVGAAITEIGPERSKVSLRSKTGGGGQVTIDVNAAARSLGGGGHAQAAGARIDAPLDEAKRRVVQALTDALG